MARDRHTCDIVLGSTWNAADGARARVIDADAGYVRFQHQDGRVEVTHHLRFRERFAPPYNARKVRSQFSMSLDNLESFHAFWVPAERRLTVRSARRSPEDAYKPSRGRGGAVPKEAIYVNTYSNPVSPDAFFGDLHDAIASFLRSACDPSAV